MMDALKQRIIACIKENQPVTTDTIHQKLNVSRNTVRAEMAKLRDIGAVHTQVTRNADKHPRHLHPMSQQRSDETRA